MILSKTKESYNKLLVNIRINIFIKKQFGKLNIANMNSSFAGNINS
jgi:hypothetical protein